MVTIRIDTRALERHFAKTMPADLNAATAKALTWTAKDAQAALVASLPKVFTIRSRWIPGSIRSTPAEISAGARATAIVGSVSEDIAPHVEGEDRKAWGKDLAVPVAARPWKTDTTPQSKWPSRLLAKPGYFMKRMRNGAVGLFRRNLRGVADLRTGRGKRGRGSRDARGGRSTITLLWVLRRRIHFKRRWHFERIVAEVVAERFATNFARGWESSKPRR